MAMLIHLVLQTTTVSVSTLNGVFWTLGGTILTALVAAAASIYASLLSAQTGAQIVRLQNLAASESRQEEFRNDYYKKIIDRRLAAYELLEQAIGDFSDRVEINIITSVGPAIHEAFKFFASDAEFDSFHKLISDLNDKTLWFSYDTTAAIVKLQRELSRIGNSFQVLRGQNIGDQNLWYADISNDESLKKIRADIVRLIKKEIIEIQDIDVFFESLRKNNIV